MHPVPIPGGTIPLPEGLPGPPIPMPPGSTHLPNLLAPPLLPVKRPAKGGRGLKKLFWSASVNDIDELTPQSRQRKSLWNVVPTGSTAQTKELKLGLETMKKFETCFRVVQTTKKKKKKIRKMKVDKDLIELYQPSRTRNVEIGLRKLKLDAKQIRTRILQVSKWREFWNSDNITIVKAMIPSKEEVIEMEKYINKQKSTSKLEKELKKAGYLPRIVYQKLGKCSKLFYILKDIPSLGSRLHCLYSLVNYSGLTSQLLKQIDILISASNSLMSSAYLPKVFHLILALGNHMNNTNIHSFSLDSLVSLQDTKSTTNSNLSFLHYIVNHVVRNCPSLRHFLDDIALCSGAMKIDTSRLSQLVQKQKEMFDICENSLKLNIKEQRVSSRVRRELLFQQGMLLKNDDFFSTARKPLHLQKFEFESRIIPKMTEMINQLEVLNNYFHYSPESSNQGIFQLLYRFGENWKVAEADLEKCDGFS